MAVMLVDPSKLHYVPLSEATVPPSGLIEHFKNMYWIVHPEKGVVYYGKHMAPQCNSSEEITRRFAEMYPDCEVRLIPSVFRHVNPHDYT